MQDAKEQNGLARVFDIVYTPDASRVSGGAAGLGAFKTALVEMGNIAGNTMSAPMADLNESEAAASEPVAVEQPAAKEQCIIQLPITASVVANGKQRLRPHFIEAGGKVSQTLAEAGIVGKEVTGLEISGKRAAAGRDLAAAPHQAGEKLPYTFTVKNAGNVNQWVVPTEGNFAPFTARPVGQPSDAGNCRYLNLAADTSYSCATPCLTVTDAELADGVFVPKTIWTVGKLDYYVKVLNDYVITSDEVDVLDRRPSLSAEANDPVVNDLDADGYASAGDTVTYEASVRNSGNVRLTGLQGDGWEAEELAAGGKRYCEDHPHADGPGHRGRSAVRRHGNRRGFQWPTRGERGAEAARGADGRRDRKARQGGDLR